MKVWSGRAHYRTDCLNCRDVCEADDRNGSAHAKWAKRHAEKNPGHQVCMEMTRNRWYQEGGR